MTFDFLSSMGVQGDSRLPTLMHAHHKKDTTNFDGNREIFAWGEEVG